MNTEPDTIPESDLYNLLHQHLIAISKTLEIIGDVDIVIVIHRPNPDRSGDCQMMVNANVEDAHKLLYHVAELLEDKRQVTVNVPDEC